LKPLFTELNSGVASQSSIFDISSPERNYFEGILNEEKVHNENGPCRSELSFSSHKYEPNRRSRSFSNIKIDDLG